MTDDPYLKLCQLIPKAIANEQKAIDEYTVMKDRAQYTTTGISEKVEHLLGDEHEHRALLEDIQTAFCVAKEPSMGEPFGGAIEELAKALGFEGGNPVASACPVVLQEPPPCTDFRGVRRRVLCRAWQMIDAGQPFTTALAQAWSEVKDVCPVI